MPSGNIDYAVAGALLLELSLAGRLAVSGDGHVRCVDATPLGDAVLDPVLAMVHGERHIRPAEWWVYRLSAQHDRGPLLRRLVDAGLLAEQKHRVLGVFPGHTRFPEIDTGPERELVAHLREVVDGTDAADPRTVGLLAILHVCMLDHRLFPGYSPSELRQRIAELTDQEWCGPAVGKVIATMNEAVISLMGGFTTTPAPAVATN
jgi:hypothetical protein